MCPTGQSLAFRVRRGFSLVEAAIVLGVIGLIVGGIWSAADSYRSTQMSNELWTGVMRAYDLFSQPYSADVDLSCAGSHDCSGRLPALFFAALDGKMNGYKPNTVVSGVAPSVSTPLQGTNLATDRYRDPLLSGDYPRIGLSLSYIPKDICLKIVAKARTLLTRLNGSTEGLRAIMFSNSVGGAYQGWYTRPPYYGSLRFDTQACSSDYTSMIFIFSTTH